MEKLDIGYHFTPTDVEMLLLLRQKAEGKSLCSRIIERDIYGEKGTPWMIFKEDDPWQALVDVESTAGKSSKETKFLYVITRLKKISELKMIRVAGCGTWKGGTGKSYIQVKDKKTGGLTKIGYKKTFKYIVKNTPNTYGNWTMHEYYLDGDLLKGVCNDYVICRIKRENQKNSSAAAYLGSEIEASEVQKVEGFSDFPGCSISIQEWGKRKYPSTFEEETFRPNKLFKCQTVEDNFKNSSNSAVDVARDSNLCEFAVQSIAGSVMELPELVNIEELSIPNNLDLFINGFLTDGQNDKLENIDWTSWNTNQLMVGYPHKDLQFSFDSEGVQIGPDIAGVSNPNPIPTSAVTKHENLNLKNSAECQDDASNCTYTSALAEQENLGLQNPVECQGNQISSGIAENENFISNEPNNLESTSWENTAMGYHGLDLLQWDLYLDIDGAKECSG